MDSAGAGIEAAPRVLVTGFEPFGGESVNPSWEVARALHGAQIAGAQVSALQLPCRFGESGEVLARALSRSPVAVVIALGQAASRTDLSVERVAINVDDAPMPDNGGGQPIDQPVIAGAPAGYFSSLPIKRIVAAMRAAGVVCNHVFYGLMHHLARHGPAGARGGFIHVPWLPGHGSPSMPLPQVVAGLRLAIETALATRADIRREAGALH